MQVKIFQKYFLSSSKRSFSSLKPSYVPLTLLTNSVWYLQAYFNINTYAKHKFERPQQQYCGIVEIVVLVFSKR